jgi:hypothetical protein
MGPQDGVDNLIRALRVLHDDFDRKDFHCVLIGGGTFQPTVAAYAQEIGVDRLTSMP